MKEFNLQHIEEKLQKKISKQRKKHQVHNKKAFSLKRIIEKRRKND